jgi:hypothetical protein
LRQRSTKEIEEAVYDVLMENLRDKLDFPPKVNAEKQEVKPEEIRGAWVKEGYYLLSTVQRNDYVKYRERMSNLGINKDYQENIWIDLASLMIGSQYAGASFNLPKYTPPRISEDQVVLIIDDDKAHATARLRDGQGLVINRMNAVLTIGKDDELPLIAERISLSEDGRGVTIEFPSPASWGIEVKKEGTNLGLDVTMYSDSWNDKSSKPITWSFKKLLYKKVPANR